MPKLKAETLIKRRIKELESLFANIDADKFRLVAPSIRQAAKMEQYLEKLGTDLDAAGFVEKYQNGESQCGRKESTESKAYSTLIKNYNSVVRTLLSCLPENAPPQAEDALMDFLKCHRK